MTNAKMPELPDPVGVVTHWTFAFGEMSEPACTLGQTRDHGQACWDAANEAALARIKELEAKLAAAEKDAHRLDYIEHTFSGMTNRERYLPVTMIWGKGCNGRTLREACDKYMKRDAAIGSEGGDD